VAVLLLGISSSTPSAAQDFRSLSVIDRLRCQQQGGIITRGGLSGDEFCLTRMKDAGRSCKSSTQCLGQCFYENSRRRRVGARVTGQCQQTNSPFGCRSKVEHGKLQREICVD
jgi:hypothetical protein